jgi:hypothetical protein
MERPGGNVALAAAEGQIRRGRKVRGHSSVFGPQILLRCPQQPAPAHSHGDSASPDGVNFPDAFGERRSSDNAQLCDGKLG